MSQKPKKEENMPQFSEYTLVNDFIFEGELVARAGETIMARQSLANYHHVKAGGKTFKLANKFFFPMVNQASGMQNAA